MRVKFDKILTKGKNMNSDSIDPDITKIPAILIKELKYTRCTYEGEISIPIDTMIHVDTDNSIALIGNDHVHIDTHEYLLLFC